MIRTLCWLAALACGVAAAQGPAALPEYRRVPEPLLNSGAPVATPAPATSAPATPPTQPAAPGAIANPGAALPPFVQARNERLSVALRTWLRAAGWDLRWDAAAGTPGRLRDFVVSEGVSHPVTSIATLLDDVLRHTGLRATLYAQDRIVVVRNADLAARPEAP